MLCLKVLSEDFSVFREVSPQPLGKLVLKLKVSPNHIPEKNVRTDLPIKARK